MRSVVVLSTLLLWACSGPDTTDVSDGTDTTGSDTTNTTDTTDTTDTVDTNDTVPSDPCLASPAVLKLGTGFEAFEDLEDGDELVMIHGPQGGWHMTGAVTLENSTELVILEFSATHVATGISVSEVTHPIAMVPTTGGTEWQCMGQALDQYIYLDVEELAAKIDDKKRVTPWALLCGEEIEIRLAAKTPARELLAEAQVTVVGLNDADFPDPDTYCGD